MSTSELAISIPIDASILRGFIELERTDFGVLPHRLPAQARAQFADPQLALVETEPSGVRLEFRTAATTIELDVLPTRRQIIGIPARPIGVYDLCVNGFLERQEMAKGASIVLIDMSSGIATREPGSVQTLRFEYLAEGDKLIEIWLPHNETTELGTLRANSTIHAEAQTGRPVWVHHGSSISHGSNAASPTGTWPAIAAHLAGLDLVNLGFGGNALLDPFTARAIRDGPADLISVKIGINLVNADVMRLRAFVPAVHGFFDTIRDGHPDIPLVVVSSIFCPIHETTPGPVNFDLEALAMGQTKFLATGKPEEVGMGKLNLEIVREHLRLVVERRSVHDGNIHYLDGRHLYGEEDHTRFPLPDRLHPDAVTHRFIGERFADFLQGVHPR